MNTNSLRAALAAVKENAVAAAENEDKARTALIALCLHGEHTRDGITYTLGVIGPVGHQRYDGHRMANLDTAYRRGPTLSDVLAWLVKPIDPDTLVEDDTIIQRDGLYARATCPFCREKAERTADLVTRDHIKAGHAYRRIRADYHWSACEHFVGEVAPARAAVFMADKKRARHCWSCEAWCDENYETCATCGKPASADPSIDAEIQGDMQREGE